MIQILTLSMWLLGTVASARAPTPGGKRDLANQPLKDRCAIAKIVAKQIVDMKDYSRWGPEISRSVETGDDLNVFVSRRPANDPEKKVSVFRKNESCGALSAKHIYVLNRDVSVTVGSGGRDDLPPEKSFELVWSKTLGPHRWELSWRSDRSIWNCPKDSVVCIGLASSPIPLPTLRVIVVKTAAGDFDIESSILEFSGQARKARPSPK
jgi:hypothetical protein